MKKNSAVIITSCLIGLITVLAYSSRIEHLREEITNFSEKIPILTATRNIGVGETLLEEDFVSTLFLKEQVSGRTVFPEDMELVVGRRVIHPLPEGDAILWTDFPEGPRVMYPSEKIPPGYRVIALSADEIHTLVHFISPGDKVDIVSSFFGDSGDKLISRLLVENVDVLGVGHQLKGQPGKSSADGYPLSVTLLVNPDNALKILRASQTGEIHFLARGSSPFWGIYDQDNLNTLAGDLQGKQP